MSSPGFSPRLRRFRLIGVQAMRMNPSKWLGIMLVLAASTGWAQVSVAQVSTVPLAVVSLPGHAPRKALGPALNQWGSNTRIFESSNWSGYAVVGTAFTQVRGSWTVPSVNCAVNPDGAASFWVGMDGWDN